MRALWTIRTKILKKKNKYLFCYNIIYILIFFFLGVIGKATLYYSNITQYFKPRSGTLFQNSFSEDDLTISGLAIMSENKTEIEHNLENYLKTQFFIDNVRIVHNDLEYENYIIDLNKTDNYTFLIIKLFVNKENDYEIDFYNKNLKRYSIEASSAEFNYFIHSGIKFSENIQIKNFIETQELITLLLKHISNKLYSTFPRVKVEAGGFILDIESGENFFNIPTILFFSK